MPKQTKQRGELFRFVGDRGENIFELAITDDSPFPRPLFRPMFFSDRWPAVDYVVELTGVNSMTPIFFVQVKSTVAAPANNQLAIALAPKKKRSLVRVPGPT
jgi:hypothetical protein